MQARGLRCRGGVHSPAGMTDNLLLVALVQTAGRRLQAATEATITVRSTFAGGTAPASKVVEAAEKAGCAGIQGLSQVFANCQLQRGFVAEEQISQQPGISLVQQSAVAGERLTFVATFTEDGQPVSKALPIALTTQPPNALANQGPAHSTHQTAPQCLVHGLHQRPARRLPGVLLSSHPPAGFSRGDCNRTQPR